MNNRLSPKLHTYVTKRLRAAFKQSDIAKLVISKNTIVCGQGTDTGRYVVCNLCGSKSPAKSHNYQVDHIDPVVDHQFIDYHLYVTRLFCSIDNLQLVCLACHRNKSSTTHANNT